MLSKPLFRCGDIVKVISDSDMNTKYHMVHLPTPFYYMNDEMLRSTGHYVRINEVNRFGIRRFDNHDCYHLECAGGYWGWTDGMFVEGRRILNYLDNPSIPF